MPRYFTVLILLGLAATSQAYAGCPCTGSTRLNQTQIQSELNGNTVCAIFGSERWQEWHSGGSILELGNDPNGEVAGTWSVAGNGPNATVVYNYGTGGTYSYSVCKNADSSFDFCGDRLITNASVKPGKGGC